MLSLSHQAEADKQQRQAGRHEALTPPVAVLHAEGVCPHALDVAALAEQHEAGVVGDDGCRQDRVACMHASKHSDARSRFVGNRMQGLGLYALLQVTDLVPAERDMQP